jgi:hypothetical protein
MSELPVSVVELYLKAGRSPLDVNSVYSKTGKPFRAALKPRRIVLNNRTSLHLKNRTELY